MSESDPCCKSCGVAWTEHLGIMGTCEKLKRAECLLGKIAAEKLDVFGKETLHPLSAILDNAQMSGSSFSLNEWCDYWKEGNKQGVEDRLTVAQIRKDLSDAAELLRSLLNANTTN